MESQGCVVEGAELGTAKKRRNQTQREQSLSVGFRRAPASEYVQNLLLPQPPPAMQAPVNRIPASPP